MIDAMCIGAHPDDVEIGMGATVAKMVREGWKVAIVDLTNGEPTPHGTPEKRAEESRRAAEILGVAATDAVAAQPLPVRHRGGAHRARRVHPRAAAAAAVRPVCRPTRTPTTSPRHRSRRRRASTRSSPRPRCAGSRSTRRRSTGTWRCTCRLWSSRRSSSRLRPRTCRQSSMRSCRTTRSSEPTPSNAAIIPMMEQLAAMWGSRVGAPAGEPFYALEPVGLRSVSALV